MGEETLAAVLAAAQREDWSGAWTQLEGALESEAPSYELLCTAGLVLHRLGAGHRARSHLLRAVAARPGATPAYLHLGDLLAAEGQPERAANYLLLATEAAPTDPVPWSRLAEQYADQGLPYAAKQAVRRALAIDAAQTAASALLAELDALFPDRDVTVYVPAFNAAHWLDRVLPALLAQSYPLREVLVIDDGSTDDTVAVAARYPVRVITHGVNKGLSNARNTALLASKSDYLANVDADVLPDRHWLERLMLHFDSERLSQGAGDETGKPLGGVMGRLDEGVDVDLADQWRTVHMAQHHGAEARDEVPHIYGCNGVYLRDALFRAGGHDERYRTNGEDCDASERVRGLGYRLAYEPAARCRHQRRDTLTSVLRTVWRYHTPYYEYRFGTFASGEPREVVKKLAENVSRHQDDLRLDQERRAWHLLYPTFLGLPWRILSDFGLATEQAQLPQRRAMGETHAALYLGLFTMLAEAGLPDDLLAMIHEDLAPCRPVDPQPAAFCDWVNVAQTIAANRGEPVTSPAQALFAADQEVVNTVLRTVGELWLQWPATTWAMVRASAWRLRDEASYRAGLAPDAVRVAIVNPPWAEDGRIGVRAGSRWPFTQDAHGERVPCYVPFPFFLATAAAMLKADGCDVLIVDAIAEGLYADEFMRRLEGFAPQVVLMETATASHEIDLDWALRCKEQLGDDTQVVLCGPHATALGVDLMTEAPQVDAILLGEYEPTFRDLLRALRDGGDLRTIPGLVWREDDDTVHAQTDRRPLPPMSSFPWPERATLPMYNYFDSFAGAMPWPNVQMHASRGCPFKCIFCVWPQVVYNGQKYRTRDNADIVAEMTFLVERYGFRAVYFDDDTFNIGNARLIDLCDRIVAAGIDVPITAMGRADTSSREALEAMKRAGLVGIKFGVETGDPAMMERIGKHLDLDKVRQAVRWCKELGLGVHLTFSFGGPGETHESARRTIDLALELDPDTVQFSLMTPFPGTSMYAAALRDGTLLTRDWKQFDGARYTVVKGEHLSREELEGLLADAHWRWSLHVAARHVRASHPGEELASVVIDSPHELSRCAPGSLDLLQLAVPVDGLFAAGRRADSLLTHAERPAAEYGNEHMVGVLADCYARLKPGGALVLGQGRPEDLPPAWEDRFLCEWATSHGLEVLGEINGFNGERMQALKRTREYDGYDELAAFAGESRSRVYRKCQHGNWWVASAWNAASPRTPAEREDFYRTSDAYLYELTHWEVNNNVPRFELSQQCRGDVLEFGCGIGTLAMFVALNGMRVDTFDLSEPETAYLRWRAAQRPFCADRLRVLAGVDELGTYDTIVCLHVLEHVEEPEQVLRMLYDHLRPGGQLLLVAPFKEELSEMHPLHLHEHADLTLDTLLTDVGAELRGWRKYDGVYDLCIGGKPALTPPVPLA